MESKARYLYYSEVNLPKLDGIFRRDVNNEMSHSSDLERAQSTGNLPTLPEEDISSDGATSNALPDNIPRLTETFSNQNFNEGDQSDFAADDNCIFHDDDNDDDDDDGDDGDVTNHISTENERHLSFCIIRDEKMHMQQSLDSLTKSTAMSSINNDTSGFEDSMSSHASDGLCPTVVRRCVSQQNLPRHRSESATSRKMNESYSSLTCKSGSQQNFHIETAYLQISNSHRGSQSSVAASDSASQNYMSFHECRAAEHIRERTDNIIHNNERVKTFVKTVGYRAAEAVMDSNEGPLVIVGNPGDGRNSIAIELLARATRDNPAIRCYIVASFSEIDDAIISDDGSVLCMFFKDILGREVSELDKSCRELRDRLHSIMMVVNRGCKIILSMTKEIYIQLSNSQSIEVLADLVQPENTIDLTVPERHVSIEDMANILLNHIEYVENNKHLTFSKVRQVSSLQKVSETGIIKEELVEKVTSVAGPMGYPHTVATFTRSEKARKLGHLYFENINSNHVSLVQNLLDRGTPHDLQQFFALLCVFVHAKGCKIAEMTQNLRHAIESHLKQECSKTKTVSEEVAFLARFAQEKKFLLKMTTFLEEGTKLLNGSFLKKANDAIYFYGPSVEKAVGLVCLRSYPRDIIPILKGDKEHLFFTLIAPDCLQEKHTYTPNEREEIHAVFARITDIIISGDVAKGIHHSLLTQHNFMEIYIQHISKTGDMLKVLAVDDKDGKSLLVHGIDIILASSSSETATNLAEKLFMSKEWSNHKKTSIIKMFKRKNTEKEKRKQKQEQIAMLSCCEKNVKNTFVLFLRKRRPLMNHFLVKCLEVAAKALSIDIVDILLTRDETKMSYTSAQMNAIIWKALLRHTNEDQTSDKLINLLISAGAEINSQYEDKVSGSCEEGVIHRATKERNTWLVKYLIQMGCDVNLRNQDMKTATFLAAESGCRVIVEILLEKKADQSIPDHQGRLPVHVAALNGHSDILQLLLEKQQYLVSVKDKRKKTPLHLAHDKEVVKTLFIFKAKTKQTDFQGNTPAHDLVLAQNSSTLHFILECDDMVIHSKNNQGKFPLTLACEKGFETEVKVLLHFHQQEKFCSQPVSREIVKHALTIAVKNKHHTIVQQFLKIGVIRHDCLQIAIRNGDIQMLLLLLKSKFDVNNKDTNGLCPVLVAFEYGDLSVIKMLLDHGADVNTKNGGGFSLIHLAARKASMEMLKCLVERHADLNALVTGKDDTILHILCRNRELDLIKYVVSICPILVDQKNKAEMTPIHIAAEAGNENIVSVLASHSAAIDIRNKDGKSAFDLAQILSTRERDEGKKKKYEKISKILHSAFRKQCQVKEDERLRLRKCRFYSAKSNGN